MNLPVSLGIKPALVTAGVLLLVIAGLCVRLVVLGAQRDTAQAQLDTRTTERDAWKGKAAGAAAANAAYDAAFAELKAEQDRRDQADAAAAQRAAAAVSAAQADAARAARQRDAYAARFAARPADCDAALQALDAACPALKGF